MFIGIFSSWKVIIWYVSFGNEVSPWICPLLSVAVGTSALLPGDSLSPTLPPSPTLLLLLHGTPCPLAPPPSPFPLTAPPIPPPPPPPPHTALALPFLEIILACTAEPVYRRPTIMMMVLKVRNRSNSFSEVSKI